MSPGQGALIPVAEPGGAAGASQGSDDKGQGTARKLVGKPGSQLRRVAALLTAGPVCSTTLLRLCIPRGASVVHRLRSLGWRIDTRPCSQHTHSTPQIEYVLDALPSSAAPLGSSGDTAGSVR